MNDSTAKKASAEYSVDQLFNQLAMDRKSVGNKLEYVIRLEEAMKTHKLKYGASRPVIAVIYALMEHFDEIIFESFFSLEQKSKNPQDAYTDLVDAVKSLTALEALQSLVSKKKINNVVKVFNELKTEVNKVDYRIINTTDIEVAKCAVEAYKSEYHRLKQKGGINQAVLEDLEDQIDGFELLIELSANNAEETAA